MGGYFEKGKSQGVSLLADPRFTRAWPGGVGDRKMGSNYAPTIHVQKEAASKGLQQVLWLYGPDHDLTEVGTMNIFTLFINDDGGMFDHKQAQSTSIHTHNKTLELCVCTVYCVCSDNRLTFLHLICYHQQNKN